MEISRRHFSSSFLLISSLDCTAQPAVPCEAVTAGAKVLAIGRFGVVPTAEQLQMFSLRLYLSGKIDQWLSPQDGNGVMLILNVPSVDAARSILDVSSTGQPNSLMFELIPIKPFMQLSRLLPSPKSPS